MLSVKAREAADSIF